MPRRGRGGGGGAPKNVSWESEPLLKTDFAPQDNYPPYPTLPVAIQPTDLERSQVSHYLSLRSQFRSGPLYTHPSKHSAAGNATKIYSEQQINEQYGRHSAAEFDAFTGMTMWSSQFEPKKRFLPELQGDCWDPQFQPQELHALLPKHLRPKIKARHNDADRRRRLQSRWEAEGADGELVDLEEAGEENAEEGEKEGEAAERDRNREAELEEDPEYDFEDVDDEMGGDYNAELYFDNGEGDDVDDGGGEGDEY